LLKFDGFTNKSDAVHKKIPDKWTKIGARIGIWLGNNQGPV